MVAHSPYDGLMLCSTITINLGVTTSVRRKAQEPVMDEVAQDTSSEEVFKLQRGARARRLPLPRRRISVCNFHRGKQAPRRRYYYIGWARTGLEPVVVIHISEAPFDALVDISANYSMIDSQLHRYLYLDLTSFQYDVPSCTGIEGACMTKSVVAILGLVELDIGILGPGLVIVRFWVADTIKSTKSNQENH